ncbi:MAG: hypothetical protein ACD_48C00672G0002 [uncultured bacterium]|nr:MAG: hypothetical protein ACD_48C00672G0002 [uncultured bacterium]
MHDIRGKKLFFIALFLVIGALGVIWQGMFFVALIVFGIGLWWLSFHLDIGWYILVFLSPMIHWMLRGVDYWYVFKDYPVLMDIKAPLVEFWALFLLVAFVISRLRLWSRGEKQRLLLPGVFWFGLFMISAFISLINVHPTELIGSAWYAIRFLLFCYIAYIVLGANIVTSKDMFRKSLYALAAGGIFASMIGFVSLFTGAWRDVYGVPRATPFALFGGWAPFGYQHIFLGETLTTTFPVFVYLWYVAKKQHKKWWASVAVFVLIVGLLTLSRAAWVTYAIEFGLFLFLLRHIDRFKRISRTFFTGIVLVSPLMLYFIYFVFTSVIVQGSNAARLALTDIALFFWKWHPIVGNGVGSFVPMLREVLYFEIEFGEAIDAHGMIQKLLSEQGIFGLLTFSLFLFWILKHLYKRYRDSQCSEDARWVGLVSLFLVLSPVIFQLFNTQYYSSKMWVPIAIAVVGNIVYRHEKTSGIVHINFKQVKESNFQDM